MLEEDEDSESALEETVIQSVTGGKLTLNYHYYIKYLAQIYD